jgi:hypothetical protein
MIPIQLLSFIHGSIATHAVLLAKLQRRALSLTHQLGQSSVGIDDKSLKRTWEICL